MAVEEGDVLTSAPERPATVACGRIAVSPGPDGYGFVDPDLGGGQILFRGSSEGSGFRLRVGQRVRYSLAEGSFALEAVSVTLDVDGDERE
jgi:cold shock CspA family protein